MGRRASRQLDLPGVERSRPFVVLGGSDLAQVVGFRKRLGWYTGARGSGFYLIIYEIRGKHRRFLAVGPYLELPAGCSVVGG